MASYRLAKSLIKLRDQINAQYPNRSKVSDGWIGNAEHASRSSDHNPWVKDGKTGIVTGLDVTHDPRHGCDSYAIAQRLISTRDERIKYVISNGRIASGSAGPSPWIWRKYTGANKHDHHVHVSVKSDKKSYDNETPWNLEQSAGNTVDETAPVLPPLLRLGAHGRAVEKLQELLNFKNKAGLDADSDFGPKTDKAVRAFQTKKKLIADGRVGPSTWSALGINSADQLV